MIARFLRYSLLFGLVFGLVWLAVVIWWQQTNRVVSAEDVIVWMLVVPVALLVSFFLLRWGYRVATRPEPAPPAAPATSASDGVSANAFDAAERRYQLAVVATGFAGSGGDSAEIALAALQAREAEPKLDDAVRDGDGFPVKTARHSALEVDDVTVWLERFAAQSDAGPVSARDHERLLRCLALLNMALPPVLETLSPLFTPVGDAQMERQAPAQAPRKLLVTMIDAAGLKASASVALEAFVAQRIADADWGPAAVTFSHLPLPGLQDATLALDRSIVEMNRGALNDVLLLIGADSALDEETLSDWSARERFHSGRRPNGLIPGEGAAALALMAPAALPTESTVMAQLHRIAAGIRDKPADDRGRITGDLLGLLTTNALDAAELKPAACAGVITDAAAASSRHVEAASMMSRLLPELDPVEDRLDLGVAFGELGAAALPALLALAAGHCNTERKPVLLCGVADPRNRFVSLMTPVIESADTAAASG